MTKQEYIFKRKQYLLYLRKAIKLGANKDKVNSYVLTFAKLHKSQADMFGKKYYHVDTCLKCIQDFVKMQKEYVNNKTKIRKVYLTKKYPSKDVKKTNNQLDLSL